MDRRLQRLLIAIAIALVCTSSAAAHEPMTNNGVTATLHVDPDDAPVAASPAIVVITSVATRTGTFTWATCLCKLTITSSSGDVLRTGPIAKRASFVFPEPAAYQLTFSGRVKRKGLWKPFKVGWPIRAGDPAGAVPNS